MSETGMTNLVNSEQHARTIALRPAVRSDGRDLSPGARTAVQQLAGARPWRWTFELVKTWAIIITAVAGALAIDHWLATVLAVLIVGTRQMVLGLLLHEQVHRLGLRFKWGDTVANLLAVYPLLATTVEDYSEVHLRHHRHFMTERDPDFLRKRGAEWEFPMPLTRIMKIVASDLTGLNTVKLIKGKTAPKGVEFKRPMPTPRWVRPVYFAGIAGVVTWLGAWPVVLIYWVLPVLSVTQLLVRWIAVLEHEYGHEGAGTHQVTPLVRMTWWQRLLIPDLNFALHVYHHNHAAVSCWALPEVHGIYQRDGKVDESAVFEGAGAYLRWLAGSPQGRA
jgi:fatty acid desaturase